MTPLEMSIKEMYQAQALTLLPSDSIKEKIEKSISDISKNNYVPNYRKKRTRRRKFALVFATVFLLSTISCAAALKIAEIRGYTNVEPDAENFDILNDVVSSYGYKINAVKDFSNGYSFKELKISYNQDYDTEGQKVGDVEKILNLEYRNEFKGVKLSLEPDNNISLAPKSILEEFEIDGVTVYVTQYIHLMIPEGYELTEEELRLQEEGILGTGTDSVTYEPSYEYYVILHWRQGEVFYSLTRLTQNATDEDLRIIAREWIEAQSVDEEIQKTQEQEEPEDFHMPLKEKLGGAKYDHIALAAEEMGYEFEPMKEFSNGYKFSWLTVGDSSDLTIMYKKDGIKVNLLIMPQGETYPYEENEIRDSHIEIEGKDIRVNHYIHFEMPTNWEEIITEEQQALLDSGAAGGGVDSASTEIIRHDSYKFIWQQGDTEFCLSNDVMNDASKEDLELMVTEWLKR